MAKKLLGNEGLLGTRDLTKLCGICDKNLHNWVKQGCLIHFRSPGKRLLFRREDVVAFLREWGYPIPRDLYPRSEQIVWVYGNTETVAEVTKKLKNLPVRVIGDLYDAAILIGHEPSRALVVENTADTPPAIFRLSQAIFNKFQIPTFLLDPSSDPAKPVPTGESFSEFFRSGAALALLERPIFTPSNLKSLKSKIEEYEVPPPYVR